MRRGIFVFITILALLIGGVGSVSAEQSTETASAAITTVGGCFLGIVFFTDGTNAVTVNIYDNASAASGTKLIPTDTVITTSSSDRLRSIGFDADDRRCDVQYFNGLYVEITCAGDVSYTVYYKPGK
jgi:hypothetical protein